MVNEKNKEEKIENLIKLKNEIYEQKKNLIFDLSQLPHLNKTEKKIEEKIKELKKSKNPTYYNPFGIDEKFNNNYKSQNLKFVIKLAMNFLNLKNAY